MGKTLVVLCFLLAIVVATPVDLEQYDVSTYIVHVAHTHAPRSSSHAAHLAYYTSFLQELLPSHISQPVPSLLYTYSHATAGFAVRLTARQATHLEAQPSVLAVVRDKRCELYTTLSPSFLQLLPSSGLILESDSGAGAVIAVIDTGIYPKDRASFAADPSLPPPPRTFRGRCVSTPAFNATAYCNNKLVGAKFFYRGYEAAMGRPIDETKESKSPLDTEGHGTHTASTAAGSAVPNANLFGLANGIAKGMALRAHIAAYKACWKSGCYGTDILAAMDEAIADKVDVMSLSLGVSSQNLYNEPVSIGAFNAISNGIVVSAAAGNDGPSAYTANNLAPWVLTVGASTMNRRFPAHVVLGNGKTFVGTSLYSGQNSSGLMKPLVYGGDVGSRLCEIGRLDANRVVGKIVLCDYGNFSFAEKGAAVKQAGGVGAIISSRDDYGEYAQSAANLLPASAVPFADAVEINTYSRSVANPVAKILFFGTVISPSPSAPRVASFSSRGPNRFAPEILKPDVIAPGVDILAAWINDIWREAAGAVQLDGIFNIISGTSMACPHVSGIAAMLKMARPSWSPAAIKSALMTTAYNVDNAGSAIKYMPTGQAAGPFELGAGHVDPNRALDPGLVYNTSTDDYISFMCGLGYTPRQIALFTRDGSVTDCSTRWRAVGDLNYPAFSVVFEQFGGQVTQRRAVTNVGGNVNVVYNVSVNAPPGTTLTVTPSGLAFNAQRQTLEYTITLSAGRAGNSRYTYGSIVWSDGKHRVTSPITVTWQ